MEIPGGLQEATLIRRYKRFLADVTLLGGAADSTESRFTIHCPNTGSMKNCAEPGSRVWFSTAANPARKYPHTWEVVEVAGQWLAGVNTGRANGLVAEAVQAGLISQLTGYGQIRREVKYGDGSRIDLLLEDGAEAGAKAETKAETKENSCPPCYVEVKNVTLLEGDGLGVFPDAISTRGQKHLRELMAVVAEGGRGVLMFCVQHSGIERVAPADHIDAEYGKLLRQAQAQGVELLAYRASFNLQSAEIVLQDSLPVIL